MKDLKASAKKLLSNKSHRYLAATVVVIGAGLVRPWFGTRRFASLSSRIVLAASPHVAFDGWGFDALGRGAEAWEDGSWDLVAKSGPYRAFPDPVDISSISDETWMKP